MNSGIIEEYIQYYIPKEVTQIVRIIFVVVHLSRVYVVQSQINLFCGTIIKVDNTMEIMDKNR